MNVYYINRFKMFWMKTRGKFKTRIFGFIEQWPFQSVRLHFSKRPLDGISHIELESAWLKCCSVAEVTKINSEWPTTRFHKNKVQPWEMFMSFPWCSILCVSNFGGRKHTNLILPSTQIGNYLKLIYHPKRREFTEIIKEREDNRTLRCILFRA